MDLHPASDNLKENNMRPTSNTRMFEVKPCQFSPAGFYDIPCRIMDHVQEFVSIRRMQLQKKCGSFLPLARFTRSQHPTRVRGSV